MEDTAPLDEREKELRERLAEINELLLSERGAALTELHDELLAELQRADSADI